MNQKDRTRSQLNKLLALVRNAGSVGVKIDELARQLEYKTAYGARYLCGKLKDEIIIIGGIAYMKVDASISDV